VLDIIGAFVNRSRATILFLVVLICLGYSAYRHIPIESTPDVKIPIIYILIKHDGISPEDSERLLVRPVETGLRGLVGLKDMTAYANEGHASIILEFSPGFDSDKALRDVRNKIDDIQNKLPVESEKPSVHEINLSLFPVLNIVLTGDIPLRTLLTNARQLRDRIEAVPGVLEVKIGGDREDSLEIIVEPHKLEAHGLSMQAVREIIAANNRLVAAGSIRGKTGEFSIKVPSVIQDLDTLLNFPIKMVDGKTLKVSDVAIVRKTFKDANDVARVNGKPSVVLEVSKRTGDNIITTIDNIKEVVESERLYWPSKLQVMYSQDQSDKIKEMVSDLENNIIFAVILVVIVVIMSVGARSAILISLSIPTAFLVGILMLSTMQLTLNTVVLFSLILTIGLIVDDAIVVSEYADRLILEGTPLDSAFIVSAKRMIWPIFTSTIVKIVVFLPLLFWPGIVGQFMKYLPITTIAILTNSLLFALFFQPALGPAFGKASKVNKKDLADIKASEEGNLKHVSGFTGQYLKCLKKVLENPRAFVSVIIATLVAVYIFFFMLGTGVEFFPKIEPDNARLIIKSPGNLSLAERDEIMHQVEEKITPFSKEVSVFYAKAGNFTTDTSVPKDTIASIFVEFTDWKHRRKAKYILHDIKEQVKSISGVEVEIIENNPGPPPEKPIQININSHDSALLPVTADAIRAAMNRIGGFRQVEDSRPSKAIEWQVIVDREKAAQFGIDIGTIGNTIQLITTGLKISSYRPEDATDEVDIMLRFPPEYRNIKMLQNVNVVTFDGKAVPISNFITLVPKPQVSEIKRMNRERVITIKADVNEGELVDTKVQQLKAWLAGAKLDKNVHVIFKGEDEDQKEAADFLGHAFMLTLVLMFMIMLIQFNNFYHTFIIMSAVFLSTVGVLIGLIVTMQPFGVVMCGVGVIALGGIVLNNNILFIDTYQHLRKDGMKLDEAILRAGSQRLRPILLTATTAVLGLLPMVFGLTINFIDRDITYDAPSSQWWRQLSASIAGGLTFATILTLFFTPCLLKIGKRFDRYKRDDD